jgi:hypothetical protein
MDLLTSSIPVNQTINQLVVIKIVMENFSRILFHKHGTAYKQHTCQSINQ